MKTADKIFIEQLRVNVHIGVEAEERHQLQPICLDIEITTDTRAAGKSDNIADTLDYSAIVSNLETWIATSQCKLLEALAEYLAEKILQTFAASAVRLRISKPNVVPQAKRIGVEIQRFAATS